MVDDGATAVSLPEVPLLGVLPGTGGLTRLVDKRKVRRDRADFFCTTEEGIKGKRAVEWGLVDEVVPRTQLKDVALHRALERAAASDRPAAAEGIAWTPLTRKIDGDRVTYPHLSIEIDRAVSLATFTLSGPAAPPPEDAAGIRAQGTAFWPLALAREVDDALLHFRFNEPTIGSWAFRSQGDGECVLAYDRLLHETASNWLSREITLFIKRVLKRLDLSARSVFALIEPGSCFAGTLMEIILAADRSFMLDGALTGDNRPPAVVRLSERNFGIFPMANGLSRLESRFLGEPERVEALQGEVGAAFDAAAAAERGLVTFTPDDIDWEDEVRLAFETRAAYSPDALTGLEASLRFAGPETMESKIFARLSAWQNWIFQRPNAMGENGALTVYGTGRRPEFDKRRA
jgi:benzoyl-CoA-dihydrodiol lyase